MTITISSLIYALLLGAGFALLYLPLCMLLKTWSSSSHEPIAESDSHEDRETTGASDTDSQGLLLQLHELLADVGRDVCAHTVEMESISHDLTEDAEPDTAKVLAAVQRVVRANAKMAEQLNEAQRTIEEQANVIDQQIVDVLTDGLTGIANRRALDHELKRRLAEFRRTGRLCCLVLFDVDHFKQLNDIHGHIAGDSVLKEIASRISAGVREMDLAARFGGEEFAIVLPDTTAEDATIVAERVRQMIDERPLAANSQSVSVTASYGLTFSLADDESEMSFVQRSDEALYASKEAGRNCGHLHDGITCKPIDGPLDADPIETHDSGPPEGNTLPRPTTAPSDQDDRTTQTSLTDLETGLPNRQAFQVELDLRMAQSRRRGENVWAMLLEIDEHERIVAQEENAGPVFAQEIARLVCGTAGQAATCARWDCHQYALLLAGINIDGAIRTADQLRKAVASCDHLVGADGSGKTTVSIGIATATAGDTPDELLRRLERSTRAASDAGGDRLYVHHDRSLFPSEAEKVSGTV